VPQRKIYRRTAGARLLAVGNVCLRNLPLCYGLDMKTRNYFAVFACLAGMASTAAASADGPAPACAVEAKQSSGARDAQQRDSRLPQVTVRRQRCTPAPIRPDHGCAEADQARAANPPPPRGTEPSFGDVPLAALMPPSPPSGAIPPGAAPMPARKKGGCTARPAS
jgi:hypothetical protein